MKNPIATADKKTCITFPKEIVNMVNYIGRERGIRTFTGALLFILTEYMYGKGYEVKK